MTRYASFDKLRDLSMELNKHAEELK